MRTAKGEKVKPNSKFDKYFSYFELVPSLLQPQNSHRYLAMRRGWIEEELQLSFGGKPDDTHFDAALLAAFETEACTVADSPGAEVLKKAAQVALKVHVTPSIEKEAHKALKEVADEAAIRVFAENVKKLLLAAPFGPKAVLGVDPGIRTGCKLALVDKSGGYVGDAVIHLKSDEEKATAKPLVLEILKKLEVQAIAVGNGTAGRETESFLRSMVAEATLKLPVVMVSESGASVYSASETARAEFPALDVTVRGAISIARRLQDPLAELVKIDPKSIGVGQYQHDVAPHSLEKSLAIVVDTCVNSVGVNLNTASIHLLAHVAGIGSALARAIVTQRESQGLFKTRQQLLDIPHFTTKTFEQAAGFLRIPGSENPLDNTGVHPERYPALESAAKRIGKELKDIAGAPTDWMKQDTVLREELGPFTFNDVVSELQKPGRDPREDFIPFQFRPDIFELKDLKPELVCPGIVTNVTNFGAFVDIGVHQDGLVHLSQMSDRFIKDPRDIVSPGDRVTVRVIEVNLEKNQVALTMRAPVVKHVERPRPQNRPPPPRGGGGGKRPPPRPQRPKFTHNPFAALAVLKEKK